VFNLTRKAGHFALPSKLKGLKAVAIPGFNPAFDGKAVDLAAMDAFCGKL
jgi:alpha-glucosidase